MRFAIVTTGSHGDVHPFIALALALKFRGHEVILFSNPYFENVTTRAGVTFEPMGAMLDLRDIKTFPKLMHPFLGPSVVVNELLIPNIHASLDELGPKLEAFAPDMVVHHHICVGVPWVTDELRIPRASVVLAPMLWFSRGDDFVGPGWGGEAPHPWVRGLRRWAQRSGRGGMLRFMFDLPINRMRRERGLADERDVYLYSTRESALNLGLWSPAFRPAFETDPKPSLICGFPWFDANPAQHTGQTDLDAFLASCEAKGTPPVLFSLGTAAVHVAGKFYDIAAETCQKLGRPGVLLVGNSGCQPRGLSGTIRAFDYVPFSTIMPRCAASVHHGGIGTTAQGLRSGRPTVIVPHSHDQFDNAARAFRLGVSLTVRRSRLGVSRLVGALSRVLNEPAFAARAGELGPKVGEADGAAVAAEAIERAAISHDVLRHPTRRAHPPQEFAAMPPT
ncbi:MAG: nucleotide disphospho-sugar-binding domain-containing protein [Phycisphaerales bacterium]|jgi:UDP:flavonoid glycosyltransferase YjiC (YdhE family)